MSQQVPRPRKTVTTTTTIESVDDYVDVDGVPYPSLTCTYTFLTILLDESGSMSSCLDGTIQGFNNFIREQKAAKISDSLRVTLVKFDQARGEPTCRVQYLGIPIESLYNDLGSMNYCPRGNTPLYDAVFESIVNTEAAARPDERILFVVITDGQENASQAQTREGLKALIQTKKASGRWTFVFMGANQDAWLTSENLAIPWQNSVTWRSTPASAFTVMKGMGVATVAYRSQIGSSMNNFYEGTRTAEEYLEGRPALVTAIPPGPSPRTWADVLGLNSTPTPTVADTDADEDADPPYTYKTKNRKSGQH